MPRVYNFPVFTTQGGGLVRDVNGRFIFIEKPNCPGLDVGDDMPAEWGIRPANNPAQQEVERDMVGTANCGCHYHAEQGRPCPHDLGGN